MTRSENITDLAAAFVTARVEFLPLKKSRTANVASQKGSYSYAYASLDDVYEAVVPALAKHGLVTLHNIETANGVIGVSTWLFHTSGQWLQTDPVWLPAGVSPQATGSAISYARRYSLQATLGLAAEDDDDGQSAADAKPAAKAAAKDSRDRAPRAAIPPAPSTPTPSAGQGRAVPAPSPGPGPEVLAARGARLISEAQVRRLWTLARKQNWQDQDIKALILRFGFESSKDITLGKYDEIVAAVETGEDVGGWEEEAMH